MPKFKIDTEGLPEESFSPEQDVVQQGEQAGKVYVLKSGAVKVTADGRDICTVDEPMTIFGEMSVLLDTTHGATVTATAESTFYVIEDLLDYAAKNPQAALHMARVLAQRVMHMNEAFLEIKGAAETAPAVKAPTGRLQQMIARMDQFWGRDIL